MVRLVSEPDKKKKDLSDEAWFKQVKTTLEEYTGRVKLEETGRYYLLWVKPIVSPGPGGKDKFLGSVAVRIDLWDCFQKYSKTAPEPMLVRMGHLYLYSHDWSDTIPYGERQIEVPGVKKLFVRTPDSAPAPDTVSKPTVVSAAPAAKAQPPKKGGNGGLIAFLIVVIVLESAVLASYLIKPLAALRQKLFPPKQEDPA
jgi:hypothetical protein